MADLFAIGARVKAGPLTGTVLDTTGVCVLVDALRLVKFDTPSNATGVFPVSILSLVA